MRSKSDAIIRRCDYRVCVFSSHSFWTSSSLDVPAGVTQEEGHTGFLIHLLSHRAHAFSINNIKSAKGKSTSVTWPGALMLHDIQAFICFGTRRYTPVAYRATSGRLESDGVIG